MEQIIKNIAVGLLMVVVIGVILWVLLTQVV